MTESNNRQDNCPIENPENIDYIFPWEDFEDRRTPLRCQFPEKMLEIRNDPIEAVAYIRKLLEVHINNPENLFRKSLKEVVSSHTIKVNGVGYYDASAQGEKPCIYMKYAGSKFQQDFAFDNSIGYNNENATETFYGRHMMAFSVFALSDQYTESLALIEEVRRFLYYMQAPIKRSLCWKRFEVLEMQAPAKDENFDCFTSTLNCSATFDESWSVKEAVPLLKKIDLTV